MPDATRRGPAPVRHSAVASASRFAAAGAAHQGFPNNLLDAVWRLCY
jgi:hypothetical protein